MQLKWLALIGWLFLSTTSWTQYMTPDIGYVFQDNEVPRIDILMDQDSLDILLADNNRNSNHEFPVSFTFTTSQGIETLENVGFRLRGNTSRSSSKPSFKVSFNSFESGRKFYDLEKLNLNGEHNDPSIMRSKLCWDTYAMMDIPVSRVNHVELYVNDDYRGLYINVEHIDEEYIAKRMTESSGNLFKCLWPADLVYLGSDPIIYEELAPFGRQAYDLKTNTAQNDYTDLVRFINILNNTPPENFQCEIEKIFDVNNYLKVIVMDILTSNWDGPIINKNNFYLYHDPIIDRFTYIPYDLDNTVGIDFFNIDWPSTNIYNWVENVFEDRPIYSKIMSVPEYRDRFSFYMDKAITEFFNNQYLNPYLDLKLDLIKAYRFDDVYAMGDYGYTYQDFLDSYEMPFTDHVKYGLKDYIETRVSTASDQLSLNDVPPFVVDKHVDWSENQIIFNYLIDGMSSITGVTFHYSIDGVEWMEAVMTLDQSGYYTYVFNVDVDPVLMTYYIEARDENNLVSFSPYCKDATVQLGFKPTYDLVINEFMASNTTSRQDEFGEHEDWIEIYNNGDVTVPLFDYYLTDNPNDPNKWKLPHVTLSPDSYLIIWADDDNSQGDDHTNFSLKRSGEFIGIFDNHLNHYAVVDSITYLEQTEDVSFERSPNGIGAFAFAEYPTFGYNNDAVSHLQEKDEVVIEIYPNPAVDHIYVTGDEIQQINIFDVSGKLLISHSGNKNQIDVSDLSSGLFLVELINLQNKKTISKLVIR